MGWLAGYTAASGTSAHSSATPGRMKPSSELATPCTSKPGSAIQRAGLAAPGTGLASVRSPSIQSATRSSTWLLILIIPSKKLRDSGDNYLDVRRRAAVCPGQAAVVKALENRFDPRIPAAPRRFVWNATVTCRGWLRTGARCAAGSRLAVGHPKGLALTRSRSVRRSPKGCRSTLFLAGNPDGRGRLAPFPPAGRAGDGWPPTGKTVNVAFHTKRHRAIPARIFGRGLKLHCLRAGQHLAHLLQRAHLRFIHVNHHQFDDRPASPASCQPAPKPKTSGPLQAHSSMESRARLQAHTTLDKAYCCGGR